MFENPWRNLVAGGAGFVIGWASFFNLIQRKRCFNLHGKGGFARQAAEKPPENCREWPLFTAIFVHPASTRPEPRHWPRVGQSGKIRLCGLAARLSFMSV